MNADVVLLSRQSVCATCLSQERKLFPVIDSKARATFLVNLSEGDRLCWECHFFVLKVAAFRSRAARAQALLAGALHQTNETKINSLSSLKMTPVYLEVSLQTSDVIQEHCMKDTLYECPGEDNCNSDNEPDDDSLKDVDDKIVSLNEQTEEKYDEGACSDTTDDDITNTCMKLLNDKELLNKRQESPCELGPGRDADAAAKYRHVSAGDEPARSRTRPHPLLRSCFVRLEQVPLADNQLSRSRSPVIFDHSYNQTHADQQATLEDGNVHASSEKSRLCTPTQTQVVDKSHICNTCGKHFKTRSRFNKHIMIHAGENSFRCDTCDKLFYRRSALVSHLHVHTVEKPFCCDTCHKSFKYKSSLTTHLLIHTGKKQFICDKCGKRFYSKATLRSHLYVHVKVKTYSCDVCNKLFARRQDIIRHIRAHTGEKRFCCDVCGKRMTNNFALLEHLRIHTNKKLFFCDKCGKRYNRKSGLTAHLRTHTTAKPFSCDICVKRFALKSFLVTHLKSHSTDKPFCCNICHKRFKTKSGLLYHSNAHTGEKFRCDICQKLFSAKQDLRRHTRLVHTLKDERPFCCDICQKRFKLKTHLSRHIRLHTGERPYGCDVCGKRFNEGCVLKVHTRIHTGEKPFSCEICGKRFNQNSPMKIHLRTHTGKKGAT